MPLFAGIASAVVNMLLQRRVRVQQNLEEYTPRAIARVLVKLAERAMHFAANASNRDAAAALKETDFRHSILTAGAGKIRSGKLAYQRLVGPSWRFPRAEVRDVWQRRRRT